MQPLLALMRPSIGISDLAVAKTMVPKIAPFILSHAHLPPLVLTHDARVYPDFVQPQTCFVDLKIYLLGKSFLIYELLDSPSFTPLDG